MPMFNPTMLSSGTAGDVGAIIGGDIPSVNDVSNPPLARPALSNIPEPTAPQTQNGYTALKTISVPVLILAAAAIYFMWGKK